MIDCWLKAHGLVKIAGVLIPVREAAAFERCEGRMDRAHLVPKRLIRAQIGEHDLIADIRIWVPGCRQHHGLFDRARKLRIPIADLPAGVWAWIDETRGMEPIHRLKPSQPDPWEVFRNFVVGEYGPWIAGDKVAA